MKIAVEFPDHSRMVAAHLEEQPHGPAKKVPNNIPGWMIVEEMRGEWYAFADPSSIIDAKDSAWNW